MGIFLSFIIAALMVVAYINETKKESELRKMQIKAIEDSKEKYKSFCENIKRDVKAFKILMYTFALKNKRLRRNIYDIEEGGEYLTEYNKSDCNEIDKIVDEELDKQSSYFKTPPPSISYRPVKIENITEERIKERIINEKRPYSDSGKDYYGF